MSHFRQFRKEIFCFKVKLRKVRLGLKLFAPLHAWQLKNETFLGFVELSQFEQFIPTLLTVMIMPF
jgi:hypothetical protein